MKNYEFSKRIKNPHFNFNTVVPIRDFRPVKIPKVKNNINGEAFESCLIPNNSENNKLDFLERRPRPKNNLLKLCQTMMESGYYGEENRDGKHLYIKTVPPTLTELHVQEIDEQTGEITDLPYPHLTNEFKAANNRKKKALNKFCDFYEPLYLKRQVSVLFFTFTGMNNSKLLFSDLLDNIKYHFSEQLKRPVRGYFWALEVSKNLHLHYHLCVAIDRLAVRKMPKALMFETLWGQRTQVAFVKKSVRRYLSKYLAKDSYRAIGLRSYGKSYNFT